MDTATDIVKKKKASSYEAVGADDLCYGLIIIVIPKVCVVSTYVGTGIKVCHRPIPSVIHKPSLPLLRSLNCSFTTFILSEILLVPEIGWRIGVEA